MNFLVNIIGFYIVFVYSIMSLFTLFYLIYYFFLHRIRK